MVEGGAAVIAAFLNLRDNNGEALVDMHVVTVAPTIIGPTGVQAASLIQQESIQCMHMNGRKLIPRGDLDSDTIPGGSGGAWERCCVRLSTPGIVNGCISKGGQSEFDYSIR